MYLRASMKNNYFILNCCSSRRPDAKCKISPQDAEKVLLHKWSFTNGSGGKDYVRAIDRTRKPPKQIKLHRYLLDAPEDMQVDHINGDPLDNRRENLRLATPSQNQANGTKRAGATSVYKGVSWHKKARKWRATIGIGNGKQQHLGFYRTPQMAALAYDFRAFELWGAYAKLNFPKAMGRVKPQSERVSDSL